MIFFWSPFPTKRSTNTPPKFGENSEQIRDENSKIRETFDLQLLWPKKQRHKNSMGLLNQGQMKGQSRIWRGEILAFQAKSMLFNPCFLGQILALLGKSVLFNPCFFGLQISPFLANKARISWNTTAFRAILVPKSKDQCLQARIQAPFFVKS